ncbi:hypothetical protein BX666DRAFT_2027103 [Dichotomocladium elegans]|nr:hypothetical protein BX666DRAFT_2027103 [Dichotomocladium elegans]
MFHTSFFSRRLRQKSEEIIPKRISRFFHTHNTNNVHVHFSDKLEVPTTPTSSDWCYASVQHVTTDDMMLIRKDSALVDSDLSTCGASNTTMDDDALMYDEDMTGEDQQHQQQQQQRQQHKYCMQLANHVRIVLGNAFIEADEQLEKEHLL